MTFSNNNNNNNNNNEDKDPVGKAKRDNNKMTLQLMLALGVIVAIVLILFMVQNFTILNDIRQNTEISNLTQFQVNQTALFLESTKHEDEARDNQSKLEMEGRSNQTKIILNNTRDIIKDLHHDLENLSIRENNTTLKVMKEIQDAQVQNDLIQNTLQELLNKYGGEGTILLRYLVENITNSDPDQIIKKENNNNNTNQSNNNKINQIN